MENRSYLPPCWSDDRKIQSLFSSFRKKELNPVGWQEKMNFWVKSINRFSRTQNTAVITATDVCLAFERNKKSPACIDEVFNYMHRQNNIVTVEEFIYRYLPQGWLSWSYNAFLKYPVIRIWSFIRDTLFSSPASQRFVVLDVLKVLANLIFEKYEELRSFNTGCDIMPIKEFEKMCVDVCTGENFKLAVMQLEHANKVKVFREPDGNEIIKFQMNDDPKFEISDVDRAVLRLRKAICQVSQKVDKVIAEQQQCVVQAKQYAREGSKSRALLSLKKKRRLEEDLLKRIAVQDNLEIMLNQVQNCSSEKMVLDAYSAGAAALKSCLTTDLVLRDIDETMDNVKQGLDDFNDVQTALAGNLDDTTLLALEDELAEILNIETEVSKETGMKYHFEASESEMTNISDNFTFPTVPSSSPEVFSSGRPSIPSKVNLVNKRKKEMEAAM